MYAVKCIIFQQLVSNKCHIHYEHTLSTLSQGCQKDGKVKKSIEQLALILGAGNLFLHRGKQSLKCSKGLPKDRAST